MVAWRSGDGGGVSPPAASRTALLALLGANSLWKIWVNKSFPSPSSCLQLALFQSCYLASSLKSQPLSVFLSNSPTKPVCSRPWHQDS